jgi:hypothetical protein
MGYITPKRQEIIVALALFDGKAFTINDIVDLIRKPNDKEADIKKLKWNIASFLYGDINFKQVIKNNNPVKIGKQILWENIANKPLLNIVQKKEIVDISNVSYTQLGEAIAEKMAKDRTTIFSLKEEIAELKDELTRLNKIIHHECNKRNKSLDLTHVMAENGD